jgi:SAM-dependent methyltransferase
MLSPESQINLQHNREVHNRVYLSRSPADDALQLLRPWEFLNEQQSTSSAWKGAYSGNLASRLRGIRVLELGAGNGLNAVLMAKMGAQVTCIDIAEESERLIKKLSELASVPDIETVTSDVCTYEFAPCAFDLIIGIGFLHHLTHEQEDVCLERVARWLHSGGEVRFFENAENNFLLDRLRWYIPTPGRPSRFSRKAFEAYKEINPTHPAITAGGTITGSLVHTLIAWRLLPPVDSNDSLVCFPRTVQWS